MSKDAKRRIRSTSPKQTAEHDATKQPVIELETALTKANAELQVQTAFRQQLEKALDDQQTLIHVLIDNLPDLIYFKDAQSRIILNNVAHARQGHRTPEESIGKTDFDFFPTELAQRFYANEQAIIKHGQPLIEHVEKSFGPDSQPIWVLTTKVPVYNQDGQIVGIVGISRDITEFQQARAELHAVRDNLAQQVEAQTIELKQMNVDLHQQIASREQAEQKLADERNLLRTLIDSLPDPIYIKDKQSRIVINNTAHAAILGSGSTEECVGKSDFDYFPKEMAELFYGDEQVVMATANPLFNVEQSVLDHSTGGLIWHQTTKLPLRDNSGQIIGIVGISRDITDRKAALAALEHERSLLRTLIDNLPDYIFINDNDGHFLVSNLAYMRVLGQSSSKGVVGKTVFDLFPADLAAWYDKDNTDVIRSGRPLINAERTIIDQNGNIRPTLTTKVPLLDQTGQIVGLVGISRDITKQKQVEEALTRSEAAEHEQRMLAEALRDTAAALVGTLDPEIVMTRVLENVGHVVAHDRANISLIEGDMARVAYWRKYPPEYDSLFDTFRLPLTIRNLQEMLLTNAPLVIADTSAYPGWVTLPETVQQHSYAAAPIRVRGQIIGFLSLESIKLGFFTSTDVERLQAFADQVAIALENAQLYHTLLRHSTELEGYVAERTAELQRAKDHVEAILNNSSDAILVIQIDGNITRINPTFTELFGYTADEALKLSLAALGVANHGVRLESALAKVIASGASTRLEIEAFRQGGTTFIAEIGLSAVMKIEANASVLTVGEIVCSIHDITERKQIERELQDLNRLKTEFLSTAAHELRTPLTSLVGFSELLLTRELDATRMKHFIRTIHEQSVNLRQIVESLLDISRLESKQAMALNLQPVNMMKLVTKTQAYFAEAMPKYQFQIEGLSEDPPVKGDPFRLGQVLQNLVSNAIKYSPNGGIIAIRSQIRSNFLQMSIQDKGIGMTAQQQAHLFERFYRADASNTTISGTGMGLAICKLIIELHGGQIWVESDYQVGTTVHFTLPLMGDIALPSESNGQR